MKRKVQYYETDMMGIVHHANYLHWMEEARIDFMDQMGFPYKRIEAEGFPGEKHTGELPEALHIRRRGRHCRRRERIQRRSHHHDVRYAGER